MTAIGGNHLRRWADMAVTGLLSSGRRREQVGPNVWLGRAWIVDPVERLFPTQPYPFVGPFIDAAKTIGTEAYKYATQAIGFQGNNSNPNTSGWTYPTPVSLPPFLAFLQLMCNSCWFSNSFHMC